MSVEHQKCFHCLIEGHSVPLMFAQFHKMNPLGTTHPAHILFFHVNLLGPHNMPNYERLYFRMASEDSNVDSSKELKGTDFKRQNCCLEFSYKENDLGLNATLFVVFRMTKVFREI